VVGVDECSREWSDRCDAAFVEEMRKYYPEKEVPIRRRAH
jgi:hypothetical protein